MVKINKNAFEQLQETSNNIHNHNDDETEYVRMTSCYNIPKSWIQAIKKNKLTTSNYIKQALLEKLTRDGLI